MVVGAGAAFSDQSKIKNTEAVDACTALNIIGGYPDGSFKPEGNITRAEVTKMICVALNGGKNPAVSTNTTPTFSDVRNNANAAWAEGYIESCAAQGIVSGVGGGKFAPNGNVTGVQLAKMLLVSLGYKSENEGFTGNAWATNVNVRAAQKGLYEGLETMDTNAAITRDNAAQMVWNALNAYEVEYKTTLVTDSKGQLTSQITVQDKLVQGFDGFVKMTLLEDKYEAITEKGILTKVEYNDNDNTYSTTVSGVDSFDATKDYSNLMGQEVKVMYTEDNKSNDVVLLGIYATNKNKTVTALGDDMDYSKANKIEINNKDYELASDLKIVAPNGTTVAGKILDGNQVKAVSHYQYTLVDNDNDKVYEYAVVTPFSVAQIDYLTSSKLTLSAKGGTTLTNPSFNLKDDDIDLYKDAAEDDYVVVVDSLYTVSGDTVVTKADIVSGKVDGTKGSTNVTDVKVAGTWYSVATPGTTGDTIKLNDSYDFAVVNGFVFNAEKTKGNISAENILYIEEGELAKLNSGLAAGLEAKAYFADGSSQTIKITAVTKEDGDEYDIVKNSSTPKTDEIKTDDAYTFLSNSSYTMFTYSVKNGEYSLEPVWGTKNNGNIGSYDALVTAATNAGIKDGKAVNNYKVTGTNATTVARFADDAVIFVEDNDGVKVVSGKTVSNWKDTAVNKVVGLSDKSNGTQYIAVGVIRMTGTAKTDARQYGFITSAISTSKEGSTNYLNFTMWNGTESVDVKVEKTTTLTSQLDKYDFIAFDWVDEANKEADKADFEIKDADNATAVAITAFVTDDSISFSDSHTYDFADKYFVIGVDTNKGEGSTAKLATAKDCPTDSTKYCANAIYFTTTDGDDTVVEAVFIDVSGVMSTDKNGSEIYLDKN